MLIALAAAVLALVGFYATQGARNSSGGDESAAEVAPAPSEPVSRADASPAPEPKAKRAEARRAAERRGMPLDVARALADRRIVVLFFRGTDSADDRAARRAVAALRGQTGLAVFSDRIGRLGRYRAVVGDLGISQAPAVVIVDRGRRARVVQGYVDPATLAQDVADAR